MVASPSQSRLSKRRGENKGEERRREQERNLEIVHGDPHIFPWKTGTSSSLGSDSLPWKRSSGSKTEFNQQHLATGMAAQRALARLKDSWKTIQGAMWRPDKHQSPRVILVCCLLHNIVMNLEDAVVRDETLPCHQHDLSYKHQFCLSAWIDPER